MYVVCSVPGDAYLDHYLRKEKRDRDTIIIAGSLVSTICFLFVIFWFVYCCWKRQAPQESYQRPTTPLSHSNSFKSSGSGIILKMNMFISASKHELMENASNMTQTMEMAWLSNKFFIML